MPTLTPRRLASEAATFASGASQSTSTLTPGTRRQYRYVLKPYIDFVLKHPGSLNEALSPSGIREYYATLEHMADYTKRSYIYVVRKFLDSLQSQGLIVNNPARLVGAPVHPPVKIKLPSMDAVADAWGVVHQNPQGFKYYFDRDRSRVQLAFCLAYFFGLRRQEMAYLKKSHINKDGTHWLVHVLMGANGSRVVPAKCRHMDTIMDNLAKYDPMEAAEDRLRPRDKKTKELVFWRGVRGLSSDFKVFQGYTDKRVTLSGLRQACVVRWLQDGVEVSTIYRRLDVLYDDKGTVGGCEALVKKGFVDDYTKPLVDFS